ncbi:MAG: DUF3136 domain-containing protein [Synechococcus sp.]
MTSASPTPAITIGELEAKYSLYCKALRMLIREGRTASQLRRTVAWERLQTLHDCMPHRYREPAYLHTLLLRDLQQDDQVSITP